MGETFFGYAVTLEDLGSGAVRDLALPRPQCGDPEIHVGVDERRAGHPFGTPASAQVLTSGKRQDQRRDGEGAMDV